MGVSVPSCTVLYYFPDCVLGFFTVFSRQGDSTKQIVHDCDTGVDSIGNYFCDKYQINHNNIQEAMKDILDECLNLKGVTPIGIKNF